MAIALSVSAIREKIDARGLRFDQAEICAAALMAGRHVVLVSGYPERALAFAEAFAGVALEAGISLGTLTLSGESAHLLTPTDVVAPGFRDDFWLIVSRADSAAVEHIAAHIKERAPATNWRALLIATHPMRRLIQRAIARSSRHFALIEVT